MELIIGLLIGLIVLVIIFGLLTRAGGEAAGLARLDPAVRSLIYILGLLLLVIVIVYLFGSYIPLPRR